MELRTKRILTSAAVLAGCLGVGMSTAMADNTSGTTNYSFTTIGPSIGLTVSQGQTTWTGLSDGSSNVGGADTTTLMDTGTAQGTVSVQLASATPPPGLSYVSAFDGKPGELIIQETPANSGVAPFTSPGSNEILSASPTSPPAWYTVGTLGAGRQGQDTVNFSVSEGTASGTYSFSLNWQIQ